MIIDEVQAGLGRTGYLWAIYGGLYPNEKVVSDFMVLGKGMTAGIYHCLLAVINHSLRKQFLKMTHSYIFLQQEVPI